MLKQAEELFASYKLREALPLLQKAAEEGESRAYYFLGQYTIRELVDGHLEDALDRVTLEKGARAGDPLSGVALFSGAPPEDSPWYDKHKVWLKELEEMAPTDMFAAYELGCYYLDHYKQEGGHDQSLKEKGVRWLKSSAEKGCWQSYMTLGGYYHKRGPGETDYAKSAFYFEKAKAKGVPVAYFMLGAAYYLGNGVPKDKKKALKLLKFAADNDCVQAAALLGNILYDDKNKKVQKEALKYTKIAAEEWYSPAMALLGDMYLFGIGTKKDRSLAKKWYQEAASLGHEEAALDLAVLYRKEGNSEKAFETIKASAEKGSSKAMIALATFYGTGIGTEANPLLCKIWMQKAAGTDSEDAVYAKKMAEMMKYMATPEKMMELFEIVKD